jgi:hypothetical protein
MRGKDGVASIPRTSSAKTSKGLIQKGRQYFTVHEANRYREAYASPKHPNIIPNGIQWGFDLTQAKSRNAFNKFKKKHGFVKVGQAKRGDTGGYFRIYKNRKGIIMITSAEQSRNGILHLSYMRFEAPRNKLPELTNVLTDFRGSTPLTYEREGGRTWDYSGEDVGGIVAYVKEETPYEAQFI